MCLCKRLPGEARKRCQGPRVSQLILLGAKENLGPPEEQVLPLPPQESYKRASTQLYL